MNLNFLKDGRPFLILSAVLVVGAVLVFLFVTLPFRETIVAENTEIQKFNAKVENDQRKISGLRDYRDQSAMVSKDGTKLRLLLQRDKIVDFIREIEAVVKTTGGAVSIDKGNSLDEAKATFASATPVAEKTTTTSQSAGVSLLDGLPEGKTIGFTLKFTGKYSEAVDYLHRIETAPYFLSVLSLDIRPAVPNQGQRVDAFSVPTGSATPAPADDAVNAIFSIIVYLE